ncbi:PKD domain-containing protein [bacterium AH-315-M05]|nr:PKD domain-containing protein [bacterium AH-315-M05]
MKAINITIFSIVLCLFLICNIIAIKGYSQNNAPSLIYPKTGTFLSDTIIGLEWNAFLNGISYHLQVSKDSSFSITTVNDSGIINTTDTVNLNLNNKYYWRVRADTSGTGGFSGWSLIYDFTIFNPTGVNGLMLWLRADSGIISSNDTVSSWADKSGNNNNAFQSATANQPLWVNSIPELNNMPVVRFDGAANPNGDFFNLTDSILGNPSTVFVVFKKDNTASRGILLGGDVFRLLANWSDGNVYLLLDGPSGSASIPTGQITEYSLLSALYDTTLSTFTVKVNSNNFGSVSFSQTGVFKMIGKRGSGEAIDGDIAEIVMYNSALPDTSRQKVENYLKHKYAPPVNLGPNINIAYGFCDTIIDAGSGFVTYQWSTDTVNDTLQTVTITQPDTYSVTVTGIFGFPSSDTINIYFPGNLGPFNETTICLGDTIVWDTQLDTSLYSFLWQDSSTDSLLLINQAGQYYVEITDTNGCVFNSDTLNIIVDTFVLIASLGPDDTLCAGNYIELQQGASQTVSYLWSDSTMDSTLTITSPGNYWVTVTNFRECVASDTIFVTIQGIAPNADFIATSTCFGDSTYFIDSSMVDTPFAIISWFWDFGDDSTSTIQNPTHLYDSVGTYYNVTLTVVTDSGCSDNVVKAVDVRALPQANFSPVLGCSGTGVSFADLSSVSIGSLTGWEWDFGDPSSGADNFDTLQNPTHVFADSGSYIVTLKVFTNNGCIDSITQIVTIKLSPVADFSYPPACDGEYVTFTDVSSTIFPWSITNWNWDFGDLSTSTLSNPIHLYGDTGMYIVSLIVQALDGCVDTAIDSVIVNLVPVANFIGNDLCINTPYQFIDSSYVPGGIIASWYWDFDGLGTSTDQDPLFAFSDTGSFPVNLTVASSAGCTNSITDTVEVRDLPVIDFSFNPAFGPPPLTVSFTDQSSGAISYNWDFGDGSTSTAQNPTHLYADTGIYQIELNAFDAYGCKDSIVKVIKVLRPLLDIAVIDVITDLQSNYLTISVNLSNMGTRDINSLELHAQINGGIAIREDWAGTLQSGGYMTYDFNAGFVLPGNFDLRYVCISALNPNNDNDDVPSNNEQCVTFSDGFIALDPYPNPTDNEINIEYIIPYSEFVEVVLYDAIGKRVSTLFSDKAQKGLNKILLNSAFLNEGMYFYRISFIDRTEVKRFVVSK